MSDRYQDHTLQDYWHVLLRRKWIVVASVVTCLLGALAMTIMQDPVYQAQARMAVRTLPGNSVFGSDYLGYVDPERAITTEIEVLQSDLVYQRVKKNLGLTADPPHVTGKALTSADIIVVTVRSGVPESARVLADAYVNAYVELKREQTVEGLTAAASELEVQIHDLQTQVQALDDQVAQAPVAQRADLQLALAGQRSSLVDQQGVFRARLNEMQVDAALSNGGAQMVQPAALPSAAVEPQPTRTAALALFVGLLLGLGVAFFIDFLDDTVKSAADLERAASGFPVLSVVPTDPPPDDRPIAISRPTDPAVEAYRTLRTNLQFLGLDRPLKVIQLSSAMPGEGKTTTVSNLAVVLAQAGNRVALVDADLRKPRLHEVFDVDGSRGLTDVLLGEHLQHLLHELPIGAGSVSLLAAGRVPANPSEMLGSRRMKLVLRGLAERFDVVLVDSAPILPVTDSVVLSGSVDALVLVAQAARTTNRQVTDMTSSLSRVSAPVVGVVMNRVTRRQLRGGSYGYGYGYGQLPDER